MCMSKLNKYSTSRAIDQYTQKLQELFQLVPVYGFGTLEDLDEILRRVRQLISLVDDESINNQKPALLITSDQIHEIITSAMCAKTKKEQARQFDNAANQLSLLIESAIRLIGNLG